MKHVVKFVMIFDALLGGPATLRCTFWDPTALDAILRVRPPSDDVFFSDESQQSVVQAEMRRSVREQVQECPLYRLCLDCNFAPGVRRIDADSRRFRSSSQLVSFVRSSGEMHDSSADILCQILFLLWNMLRDFSVTGILCYLCLFSNNLLREALRRCSNDHRNTFSSFPLGLLALFLSKYRQGFDS
jgi:hypothetical protein